MARTAKTNHVMSLVGEKSKRTASSKDKGKPRKEKGDLLKPTNPALLPIEEELRFAQRRYSDSDAGLNTLSTDNSEQTDQAAVRNSFEKDEQTNKTEVQDLFDKGEQTDTASINDSSDKSNKSPSADNDREGAEYEKEVTSEKGKGIITAVVPELINQELDAIVKRFRIIPTDNNLWQLTKAGLESIRPEFSLNEEDYREKCGRLRQKVILEMTKAAIKISKANRK